MKRREGMGHVAFLFSQAVLCAAGAIVWTIMFYVNRGWWNPPLAVLCFAGAVSWGVEGYRLVNQQQQTPR